MIELDLPLREYLKTDAFCSSLSCHLNPPARLPAYLSRQEEPTPEMIMGSLVHSRLLQPEIPLPKLVVPPEQYPAPPTSSLVKSRKVAVGDLIDWHWGARFCKDWRAEQETAGKLVVSLEDYERLSNIVSAILATQSGQELFKEGVGEITLKGSLATQHGPVKCKARVDWAPPGNALLDIKIVQEFNADPINFADLVFRRDYDLTAAFYLTLWNSLLRHDGLELKTHFVFVVAEREPPYLVSFLPVSQEQLDTGVRKLRHRITLYAECLASGNWPGFPDSYQWMSQPAWVPSVLDRQGVMAPAGIFENAAHHERPADMRTGD